MGENANADYNTIMQTMVESIVQTIIGPEGKSIIDRVLPEIEQRIQDKYGFLPEIHEIVKGTTHNVVIGNTNEKFDLVLNAVENNIPVYLIGPAGSGKNVICKQVAEALGLDFYFSNAITQEFKINGFIDANGNYQETQFYNAFTKGGLFFLDEMDASIPEVLVALNAAIANHYYDFPIGRVDAHPDFRVIAAGNTFGTGADNNYTGRYCLDKASLDRFVSVNIDYSEKIERAITNENEELITFCHSFRKAAKEAGVSCLFSYRTLEYITKLEKVCSSLEEVLSITLLKDLGKDTIRILYKKIDNDIYLDNKYLQAMNNLF